MKIAPCVASVMGYTCLQGAGRYGGSCHHGAERDGNDEKSEQDNKRASIWHDGFSFRYVRKYHTLCAPVKRAFECPRLDHAPLDIIGIMCYRTDNTRERYSPLFKSLKERNGWWYVG